MFGRGSSAPTARTSIEAFATRGGSSGSGTSRTAAGGLSGERRPLTQRLGRGGAVSKKTAPGAGARTPPTPPLSQPSRLLQRQGSKEAHDAHAGTRLVQTTLQLGQRRPSARTCSECGMEFVAGEDEDQRLHRAYHRTFLNGVRWRNVELPQLFMAADRSYIVHVTLLSSPREWTKLMDLLQVVDRELGAVPSEAPPGAACQGFVCLGVNGNVKGCTIAEPISIAYEAVSTTECSDNPSAAICGISRIWVAAADRRKGVATRLLDAVRHRFVLGCELARNALAFSQPTSAGRHLARQYLGERYKVYR